MLNPQDIVAAATSCLRTRGAAGPLRWPQSREHDHLVDIARNLFRCPSAGIFLEGLANAADDRDSFGHHVAQTRGPLVVEDALNDPRFAETVMVRAYPHVRFYVGTAIRLRCGQLVGTIAAMDYIARERPRNAELAALESLASLAADFVEQSAVAEHVPGQAAQFDVLAARARTSVLTLALDGRITAANPAAQRLLSAPLAVLVGRLADDHVIGWRGLLRDDEPPSAATAPLLVEVVTAHGGIVPASASLSTWLAPSHPVHRLLIDELT